MSDKDTHHISLSGSPGVSTHQRSKNFKLMKSDPRHFSAKYGMSTLCYEKKLINKAVVKISS